MAKNISKPTLLLPLLSRFLPGILNLERVTGLSNRSLNAEHRQACFAAAMWLHQEHDQSQVASLFVTAREVRFPAALARCRAYR